MKHLGIVGFHNRTSGVTKEQSHAAKGFRGKHLLTKNQPTRAGQRAAAPPKGPARPDAGRRACWHRASRALLDEERLRGGAVPVASRPTPADVPGPNAGTA